MDSIYANSEFAAQIGIRFPLLSDKDGTVTRRYGLFDPFLHAARRANIVVSDAGRILDIQLDQNALKAGRSIRVLEHHRE